jgi:predicted nucleotidyltransferase
MYDGVSKNDVLSDPQFKAPQLAAIQSVLKVMAYFDLFDHPLASSEVRQFLDQPLSQEETEAVLQKLANQGVIGSINEFWGVGDIQINLQRRKAKNLLAKERTTAAEKYSRIIATFPYVRSVCLTGSYSKGVMSEDSDLDFFIITKPGRLWFAKMLMVLFRKIFLFDSHRNFCINYLITENNFNIESQNIFTAMELVTMIPAYGCDVYKDFLKANNWVNLVFPNRQTPSSTINIELKPHWRLLKAMFEKLGSFNWGNTIDRYFMNLSLKKYRSKYSHNLAEVDFVRAIEVSPKVSKVHPQFYQKIVQVKLEEKMAQLFAEAQIN